MSEFVVAPARAHGTRAKYVVEKCRCDDCRRSNREYVRADRRRVAPAYVEADTARQHVRYLARNGVGLKAVVQISGVSTGCIWKLMYGRNGRPSKRVRRETHDAICAVHPEQGLDGSRVDAGEADKIVATLLERGWTKAAIGRQVHGPDARSLQISGQQVTRKNLRSLRSLLGTSVPARRSRWGIHPVEQPDPQDELRDEARRAGYAEAKAFYRALAKADVEPDEPSDPLDLPPIPVGDLTWVRAGVCRRAEIPTWLFFPGRGDSITTKRAKATCATCPVHVECRDFAVMNHLVGVWGGTTDRDRRAIRAAR